LRFLLPLLDMRFLESPRRSVRTFGFFRGRSRLVSFCDGPCVFWPVSPAGFLPFRLAFFFCWIRGPLRQRLRWFFSPPRFPFEEVGSIVYVSDINDRSGVFRVLQIGRFRRRRTIGSRLPHFSRSRFLVSLEALSSAIRQACAVSVISDVPPGDARPPFLQLRSFSISDVSFFMPLLGFGASVRVCS